MSARKILLIGGLGLTVGCGNADQSASNAPLPAQYFDLKKLLDDQREYLESVGPGVTRTVRAEDSKPEIQRLSRISWERELHFFYEADINRPALRGRYAQTSTRLPDGSTRRTYRRLPARASAAVRELNVDTTPAGTIYRVTAIQDERNILFASERHLSLNLSPAPDHNRLVSYAVNGQQKLVFFTPTTYEVHGEIE